ncbi:MULTISPECIES: cytochrome P450 [Streptomyces]|uniref:Cytochrome P450 n=1 Tax=Streptomyces murinus TaxID=33900 RepID=A0A7W3RPR1_STRMR|nr:MULTISPECIES: cytochrome P450 [Streptomyces]NDK23367.1 cytochrome P450 [Streptomyces sp. TR1341]MBA9057511.1 cytochrome P450 [Streptomyces murinus]UWW91807.1 cytochrome P450 [Streptomyces murinus]WSI89096.1 cytochrome P450 [Streptomyces murinus]WUD10765.1 cytochrome P450 [Streptomyces murinus]
MDPGTLLARITDYASRPDPYPLYAELREAGTVVPQADGSLLIGGYHEVAALLHDPRMSADPRTRGLETAKPPFLRLDDPEHHRLRTLAMRPFGPPHTPHRVDGMRTEIENITKELLAPFESGGQVDLVDDFAYPLPVTVICRLLGVPHEDEPLFRAWSDTLVAAADVRPDASSAPRDEAERARQEMGGYLVGLAEQRRGDPRDDLLSAFVSEPDPELRLSQEELAQTAVLLLIAGHETTVNLITNGVLTLLRHPEELDRLRREPELMPRAVEELLRFEPPVHMRERIPLADFDVAGTTLPRGSSVFLALASGNRDPRRFTDPDRFDPTRADNEHLGFGSGIHLCYGAPLARLEAQSALTALLPRLGTAELVEDPPPYRQNAMLRGPRHLTLRL